MEHEEIMNDSFSRRNFIKGVGAAAAGFTVMNIGGLEVLAHPSAPKSGGVLKVGVVGSSSDIIDGQYIVSKADQARLKATFETLTILDAKFNPTVTGGLAQSVRTVSTTKVVVKLKSGIKFHNGKAVTADDVVYSFQRLLDPSQVTTGRALRSFLANSGIVKKDNLTVEFNLSKPNVEFERNFANYTFAIVPVGYRGGASAAVHIGTGPYTVKSFTPGRESVHVKNKNYWDKGKPYFDEVRIIDFADKTALANALVSRQIDAAVDISFSDWTLLKSKKYLKTRETSSGGFLAMCMRVDKAPFDDNNVRQAMRLICDRRQMVNRVLSGHGIQGNDLFGYVGDYNVANLPQRKQDIKAAVELLKKSGYTKAKPLVVDLFAPNDTAGLVAMVQAFSEQAKKTDGVVVVNPVIKTGAYWDSNGEYMNAPFHTTYYSGRTYLAQFAASYDTYLDETRYAQSGKIRDLYFQAAGEKNAAKRKDLIAQMQKIEYEQGAYIIPVFNNFGDAYNSKLQGVSNNPGQLNLDYYGQGFKNFWFA